MPEVDGPELCRRLRARATDRYSYFLLITATGGKQRYLEGMEAGADDFITKPIDIDELRARLKAAERILGLRKHVQQLEGLLPICAYCKRIRDAAAHGNRSSATSKPGQRHSLVMGIVRSATKNMSGRSLRTVKQR
jgi:DNA-binding response OmpR family regulator